LKFEQQMTVYASHVHRQCVDVGEHEHLKINLKEVKSVMDFRVDGASQFTLVVLMPKFLDKVVDKAVVKIFTPQVGITGCCLDFIDSFLDC
jgi:hypothetical protein